MCEATKTLSAINRLLLESTHPSSIADFFTYSPWDNEEVRRQAQGIIIEWVVGGRQGHLFRPRIIISIDDSLCNKPKESKHFKPVDWHFDTKEGKAYGYGVSFISMHIECGNRSLPINWRIYLREKTIRKLNRIYQQKISFRSKVTLSIEMLKEIQSLLPEGYPVHILFDSWYASKKLIQFCYLKSRLGLGDFRVRSMEGINRYFTLVFLTLAYLSWRKAEEGAKNISEVIALHRQEQYEEVLRAFGRKVIEEQSIELALKTFLPKAA